MFHPPLGWCTSSFYKRPGPPPCPCAAEGLPHGDNGGEHGAQLLGRPWARSMGTKAEAAAERPLSIQDGQLLPQRSGGSPHGDVAFGA